MPSFNPFTSVTGRHAFTLFDIRLESDFIVFRGNEHESSGQMLQGVVAVCVPGPTKIEDIHLRLTGTQHLSWIDSKITPTGISNSKVDKSTVIYQHRWPSFMGTPGKSMILEKGNYEFPFEVLLPGDTAESVEGMSEGSIVYRLKATIARGKLAYDMHAYKHIRVVRTLESSALEFLHAMSVENIWPNKVEYSIIVPQKAIVFGSAVPLETRFSPLLKGLEIGDITIKLLEIHEIFLQGNHGHHLKEHKKEREVASWTLSVTREEHWHDMIEDTGQEGWMLNTQLDLPRKLGKCMQDANVHGIKIRHKLKMVVSLKNPDGHISELRATLPITIFISPNIPLDEEGNLRGPAQQASADPGQANSIAPPGYGEHVLDQLYDEVEIAGLQTPGVQSGVSSPFYGQSRSGSSENLAAMLNSNSIPVPPAALSSRLEGVSQSVGGNSLHSNTSISGSGFNTPPAQHVHGIESASTSPAQSAPLSRHNSGEEGSGQATPEHLDYPEMSVLCKVPSYATAIKTTRVAPLAVSERVRLPDYQTVISAPTTPTAASASLADPLTLILEASNEDHHDASAQGPQRPASLPRRQTSPLTMLGHHLSHGDADERQRLHLLRARERVA